jgi:hypothetical protein
MNLDPANIHTDHFLERTRHLVLDVAAHFTDVDMLFQDELEIRDHNVVFDLDPNSIPHPALEQTVYSTRDLCHAADARYA